MPITEVQDSTFDDCQNMARQSLYRFTSLCLLDPRKGCWKQLDGLAGDPVLREAAQLIRELPEAKPDELGRGEHPLAQLDPRNVLSHLPVSSDALNAEYERTFGLLVANACPPYETEYIHSKLSFQRSNAMADLSGFYHAFGLKTSDVHPERPDHIVLELEFMAVLLGLERRAADDISSRAEEQADVCRSAQKRFLEEHLAWWAPAFALLLGRENAGGFYAAVGEFLAALIPAERAILGIPWTKGDVHPNIEESPDDCAHCQR